MSETPLNYAEGDAYELVDKDGDSVRVTRASNEENGAVVQVHNTISYESGAFVSPEYAPRLAQAILDAAGVKFRVVLDPAIQGPPPGVPAERECRC